jgi:hypothetical protein
MKMANGWVLTRDMHENNLCSTTNYMFDCTITFLLCPPLFDRPNIRMIMLNQKCRGMK